MAQQPQYIEKLDWLDEGRDKLNRHAIDPAYRAEVNSEQAVEDANRIGGEAKDIALEADSKSQQAVNKAVDTDERLDNLIVGELQDGEVIDARRPENGDAFPTVGKRLNSQDEELTKLKNTYYLPLGPVYIPSNFGTDINVTKNQNGSITNDFSVLTANDWSQSTEVFITCRVSSAGLGTNFNTPVGFQRFIVNYTSGLYGSQKSFILTILDKYYDFGVFSTNGLDCDLLIRSRSFSGKTWVAPMKGIWSTSAYSSISNWVYNGGVYETTQTTNDTIIDVVNGELVSVDNAVNYFTKVTSLALCKTTPFSFYQSGAQVSVNPGTYNIDDCSLLTTTRIFNLVNYTGKVLAFENINLCIDSFNLRPTSYDTHIIFSECTMYRGLQNGLSVFGQYKLTLSKCRTFGTSADGFNYHGDAGCLVRELDCNAFDNGTTKMVGGNTSTSSNNCSTAHDGLTILRVNNRYWNCQGGMVADVNGCASLNIGCQLGDFDKDTQTADRVSFLFNNTAAPNPNNKQYVIECFTTSKTALGIQGSGRTYFMNLSGSADIENAEEIYRWEASV